jgi:TetR/AcrR family transcriptional repressor of mexJK operon
MASPASVHPKGRPSKALVAARDVQLADIAFDLFMRDGYHAVSLAMIAAEAHVAVRTIYTSFGGKTGILAALIERERQRHLAQLAQLQLPLHARARLVVLAGHLLGRLGDARMRGLQVLVIGQDDRTLAGACYQAGPGQFLDLLHREMLRAQDEGLVDASVPALVLADLFVGVVRGGDLGRFFAWDDTSASPHEEIAAERVRLFLDALGSNANVIVAPD